MTIILIVSYIVIALITYGLLLYYKNEDFEGELLAISLLWPIMLILIIFISPFYLIEKIVYKLKKINKREKFHLEDLKRI